MSRTKKYVAMTRDEGNAVDGPFSATWKLRFSDESIIGKISGPGPPAQSLFGGRTFFGY
jgi:hypothetical protein